MTAWHIYTHTGRAGRPLLVQNKDSGAIFLLCAGQLTISCIHTDTGMLVAIPQWCPGPLPNHHLLPECLHAMYPPLPTIKLHVTSKLHTQETTAILKVSKSSNTRFVLSSSTCLWFRQLHLSSWSSVSSTINTSTTSAPY